MLDLSFMQSISGLDDHAADEAARGHALHCVAPLIEREDFVDVWVQLALRPTIEDRAHGLGAFLREAAAVFTGAHADDGHVLDQCAVDRERRDFAGGEANDEQPSAEVQRRERVGERAAADRIVDDIDATARDFADLVFERSAGVDDVRFGAIGLDGVALWRRSALIAQTNRGESEMLRIVSKEFRTRNAERRCDA